MHCPIREVPVYSLTITLFFHKTLAPSCSRNLCLPAAGGSAWDRRERRASVARSSSEKGRSREGGLRSSRSLGVGEET